MASESELLPRNYLGIFIPWGYNIITPETDEIKFALGINWDIMLL
jgi:hypothetical protein